MQHPMIEFDRIDKASRGPLGCAQALGRQTGGSSLALGTAVIVLAVAIDPFVQQLVQLQSLVVYRNDTNAALPTATRYSKGFQYSIEIIDCDADNDLSNTSIADMNATQIKDYVDCQTAYASSDYAMQSAILFGLSNPQKTVRQQLDFGCPSGNCTWGEFQSLAICSKYEDVGNQLKKNPPWETDPLSVGSTGTGANGAPETTSFSLPNGLWIDNADNSVPSALMTSWSTSSPSDSISFKSVSELLWSISFLNVTSSGSWPNASVEATECALYYCVNEYSSKAVNGSIVEYATELSSAKRSDASWQPANTARWTSHDPLVFDSHDSSLNRTDLMLGNGFNVSQTSVDGINSFFQSTFILDNPGRLDLSTGAHLNGIALVPPSSSGPPESTSNAVTQFMPDVMQAFYQSSNLTDMFEDIAWSMTNAIRTGADSIDGNPSTVPGRGGILTTHYSIQWPWISLPITLIIVSYLFLLMGVYYCRKAQIGAWKSSSLAILARGSEAHDQFKDTFTIHAMEDRAKDTYARLLGGKGLQVGRASLLELSTTTSPFTPHNQPPTGARHSTDSSGLENVGQDWTKRTSTDFTRETDTQEQSVRLVGNDS
ncbi:MAG: hypothetical protein M1821_006564 [Bathelium mastoideum]|nr:MAG: hypothetical protein M1821_006564 [Bathelium mastoideum]